MKKSEIQKAIGDNRQLLYEAVSILQLIDYAEDTDGPANVYSAAHAVARMVDKAANDLDKLDTRIGHEMHNKRLLKAVNKGQRAITKSLDKSAS